MTHGRRLRQIPADPAGNWRSWQRSLGADPPGSCLLRRLVIKDLLGDIEAAHCGADPAIHRSLQQHFADLILGATISECATYVEPHRMGLIERGGHGQAKHASHLARQAGSGPNRAPTEFVGEVVEQAHEVVRIGQRLVDIFWPQYFATNRKTYFSSLAHIGSPSLAGLVGYRSRA